MFMFSVAHCILISPMKNGIVSVLVSYIVIKRALLQDAGARRMNVIEKSES